MTMQKQKRDRTLDCLTYSSQRKHWRFSLLLRFHLHSSRSGRFCKNPLPSLKVAADFNVASSWVSVTPLHASLSACDRNRLYQYHVWSEYRGVPNLAKKSFRINLLPGISMHDFLPMSHEVVFVPDSSWIVLSYTFAIHLLPEGRSFPAQNIINTYPTFITFEYFIEHPLSEIAMSRRHYGCFFINLQGMIYCKNMIWMNCSFSLNSIVTFYYYTWI